MNPRPLAFVIVGGIGFLIQAAVLAALTGGAHWPVASATALAVEAAVLTNFFWHDLWTWRHRARTRGRFACLWRFHVTNGATSIVGNVIITTACVRLFEAPPVVANILAVVLLSAVNYTLADRWVFPCPKALGALGGRPAAFVRRRPAARVATREHRHGLVAGFALLMLTASSAGAAELTSETVIAWNRYVAAVERSLSEHERDPPLGEPEGRSIEVPGGAIHQWRGSVTIHGATVQQIVDALLSPGARLLQEDVAESRVLERHGDSLLIYLKLVRKVIVTATYDTEHDVRYSRRSTSFATSRSVATKIVETGGSDRGFLSRLNSYWRYRQVGNAVQIDVLSLSLSRDIPWVVRPIAQPLINRIGRESMSRTLATVERTAETIPGRAVMPRRASGH